METVAADPTMAKGNWLDKTAAPFASATCAVPADVSSAAGTVACACAAWLMLSGIDVGIPPGGVKDKVAAVPGFVRRP